MVKFISKKSTKNKVVMIILIIAIMFIGVVYINNRKTNVLKEKDVNMRFEGYEGTGTAVYDTNKIKNNIIEVLAKKAKLSTYWTEQAKKDPSGLTSLDAENTAGVMSTSTLKKLLKVGQWYEEISVNTNSESNLKNGETVKLTLKVENDKSNPIKSATQAYKVKGLKKIRRVSTSKLLSSIKATFRGFSGKGKIVLKSKKIKNSVTIKVANNGELKNGETLRLTIPKAAFKVNGINYVGSRILKVKVEGLIDVTKIGNFSGVKAKTDTLINQKDSNSTNTLVGLYAVPEGTYTGDTYGPQTYTKVSNKVELNDDTEKKSQTKKFTLVAVYKIVFNNEYGIGDSSSSYETGKVVIKNLTIKNNEINLQNIKGKNTDVDETSDSLNTVQKRFEKLGTQVK